MSTLSLTRTTRIFTKFTISGIFINYIITNFTSTNWRLFSSSYSLSTYCTVILVNFTFFTFHLTFLAHQTFIIIISILTGTISKGLCLQDFQIHIQSKRWSNQNKFYIMVHTFYNQFSLLLNNILPYTHTQESLMFYDFLIYIYHIIHHLLYTFSIKFDMVHILIYVIFHKMIPYINILS